jgi:hypothetical protein
MYRLVEEPDHVLCGAFVQDVRGGYVAAVLVEDCDEPSVVYEFEVALPEAVGMPA